MSYTIEVDNLTKEFDEITAVSDVSFKASKGEIIALLGPNGAGKSTLMNMITGFIAPTKGTIKILEKNINDDSVQAKSNIGFLPEGAPIYPDLNVKQFLNYMAELRGYNKNNLDDIIKTAKIEEVLNQKVETLSKGYLRRVGFAQSIINNPPILLLDEPTDGLDPNQKEHMQKLIKQMGKDKTIIISTHLLDEAENIASRIILINRGKIMTDGSLNEVLKSSKSKTLADVFKKLTKECPYE